MFDPVQFFTVIPFNNPRPLADCGRGGVGGNAGEAGARGYASVLNQQFWDGDTSIFDYPMGIPGNGPFNAQEDNPGEAGYVIKTTGIGEFSIVDTTPDNFKGQTGA